MALTRVAASGISTVGTFALQNINTSGIVTATGGFVGDVTGNVTGDLSGNVSGTAVTATTANFTNATISGDLTVQGTTTTLDTTLTEVDKLEVGANNTTVGVAITQSGTGDILRLYDSSTQVVTVADGGNFGINTANPTATLHIAGGTARPALYMYGSDKDIGYNSILQFGEWDGTTYNERMRIDNSGRLLVGTNGTHGFYSSGLQVAGSNLAGTQLICRTDNNQYGANLYLAKTRGTSIGSKTIVQSGDIVGQVIYSGTDGVGDISAAVISGEVDGTPGASNMPGRLVFSTNGGAGSPTERMRIDSSGRLLVGTTTEGEANADDLTVANSGNTGITIRSGTANKGNIYFSDGTSGDAEYRGYLEYNHDGDRFSIGTANATRLFIDSSGRVMIGTTTEGEETGDDLTIATTGHTGITIRSGTSQEGNIFFSDGTSGSDELRGSVRYYHSLDTLTFAANATERLRITSDGKIGISQSSPYADVDITTSTEGSTGTLSQHGIRLAAVGAADEDVIPITAGFLDNQYRARAGIGFICKTDSVAGYAGAIAFYTRSAADGSGLLRTDERMRLDEGGNLGIGIANPSYRLHSYDTSGAQGFFNGWSAYSAYDSSGAIRFGNQTSYQGRIDYDASGNTNFVFENSYSNGSITWKTNGTERMRIHPTGKITVRTTNITNNAELTLSAPLNSGDPTLNCTVGLTAGTVDTVIFRDNSGHTCGRITVNAGTNTTSYNTSSDYRLKENVVPLTGAIERLNQLQVKRFNFISEPETVFDGFLAHEAQEVVPECATHSKDAVDADGNPIYQGIDQSKLVPLLTAALQEAIAKIETLEAEVAALKAQ